MVNISELCNNLLHMRRKSQRETEHISPMVRAFARGAMGRRINSFIVDPLSSTGVTKAVVCAILYMGWYI